MYLSKKDDLGCINMGMKLSGVKMFGSKYPSTFQTGKFRNWINKSSIPFPTIGIYQRGDRTSILASALKKNIVLDFYNSRPGLGQRLLRKVLCVTALKKYST